MDDPRDDSVQLGPCQLLGCLACGVVFVVGAWWVGSLIWAGVDAAVSAALNATGAK